MSGDGKAPYDSAHGIEQDRRDFKRDHPALYEYVMCVEIAKALKTAGDIASGAESGHDAANGVWSIESSVRRRAEGIRSQLASSAKPRSSAPEAADKPPLWPDAACAGGCCMSQYPWDRQDGEINMLDMVIRYVDPDVSREPACTCGQRPHALICDLVLGRAVCRGRVVAPHTCATVSSPPTEEPTVNKARRKTIGEISARISDLEGTLQEITSEIESVLAEEQDAYDNMPESLQESDRGQASEAALDALDEAKTAVETMLDTLTEAVEALNTASE